MRWLSRARTSHSVHGVGRPNWPASAFATVRAAASAASVISSCRFIVGEASRARRGRLEEMRQLRLAA